MTSTLINTANTLTPTSLGVNKNTRKPLIGIITYRTTTGQLKTCEVYSPFWSGKASPDSLECAMYLLGNGYGLIRYNTISYRPLV